MLHEEDFDGLNKKLAAKEAQFQELSKTSLEALAQKEAKLVAISNNLNLRTLEVQNLEKVVATQDALLHSKDSYIRTADSAYNDYLTTLASYEKHLKARTQEVVGLKQDMGRMTAQNAILMRKITEMETAAKPNLDKQAEIVKNFEMETAAKANLDKQAKIIEDEADSETYDLVDDFINV